MCMNFVAATRLGANGTNKAGRYFSLYLVWYNNLITFWSHCDTYNKSFGLPVNKVVNWYMTEVISHIQLALCINVTR